jgi:hypothetical protein
MRWMSKAICIGIVSTLIGGCGTSSPSATDAYNALHALSSDHALLAMQTGTPSNCREATSRGRSVLVCSVCVLGVSLQRNVIGSILRATAIKGDYDVSFRRALSFAQPDLEPTGSGGVWIVDRSTPNAVAGPLNTRFIQPLDPSTFGELGLRLEQVNSLGTMIWEFRRANGETVPSNQVAADLTAPAARQLMEARYGACEDGLPAEHQPVPDVMAGYNEAPQCSTVISDSDRARIAQLQGLDPVINRIHVTPDSNVQWNDTTIDLVRFRQYLDYMRTLRPQPLLVLTVADGVERDKRRDVAEIIVRALSCRPRRNLVNL